MNEGERRTFLATFLRRRRAQLKPHEVGLPAGERRRTPGLRREEVALLAGVGITWYTWLEQGRDVTPSASLLERLCQVLRLNADERLHLFTLAGQPLPLERSKPATELPQEFRSLLDALDPCPAHIRNQYWDVLAWNRAEALFTDWEALPVIERNVVFNYFLNPRMREMLIAWEHDGREVVANFRMDYARSGNDPVFAERIAQLQQRSSAFALRWSCADVVQGCSAGPEERYHPLLGTLVLGRLTIPIKQDPLLTLRVLLPIPGTNGREQLSKGIQRKGETI